MIGLATPPLPGILVVVIDFSRVTYKRSDERRGRIGRGFFVQILILSLHPLSRSLPDEGRHQGFRLEMCKGMTMPQLIHWVKEIKLELFRMKMGLLVGDYIFFFCDCPSSGSAEYPSARTCIVCKRDYCSQCDPMKDEFHEAQDCVNKEEAWENELKEGMQWLQRASNAMLLQPHPNNEERNTTFWLPRNPSLAPTRCPPFTSQL